jgi:hypothetical protein
MKTVNVVAHSFDCLPGHVTVAAKAKGGNVRVATARAVGLVFLDERLRRKQISDFKLSVVVISDHDLR